MENINHVCFLTEEEINLLSTAILALLENINAAEKNLSGLPAAEAIPSTRTKILDLHTKILYADPVE